MIAFFGLALMLAGLYEIRHRRPVVQALVVGGLYVALGVRAIDLAGAA